MKERFYISSLIFEVMREFVYFSSKARTSGNFPLDELMKAGRMDIVCNVIIHVFFISNHIRDNVKLHLIFYGMPDPPKHIIMNPGKNLADIKGRIDISKKDIAGLIKRILYKYKDGKKTEVFPGFSIEKKSLFNVLEELKNEGKEIYILDNKGEDIRNAEINPESSVFLLGDQEGLPFKELKRLKKQFKLISVGRKTYFASQVVTIVNNELDRREE